MNVLVIAHKEWGKDAVCDILAAQGITSESSSMFAAKTFLFDQLKDKYGYTSVEECHADRGTKRTEWFNAIRAFNEGHLSRLAEGIMANFDIYNGMRNREEFEACKAAGTFDLIIWIDASERCEPEPPESMELCREDAHIVLDNNGPEEALPGLVLDLMRKHLNKLRAPRPVDRQQDGPTLH